MKHLIRSTPCLATAAGVMLLGGCVDPLSRDTTDDLRNQVIAAHKQQADAFGQMPPLELRPVGESSYLSKDPRRAAQLDSISGISTYRNRPLDLAYGLDDKLPAEIALSLQYAIQTAVKNNLDLKVARLQPAISEADIVRAEAAFDAVFFTDASWGKTDRPEQIRGVITDPDGPGPLPSSTTFFSGSNRSAVADTASLETGIRKKTSTGATVTASTGFEYSDSKISNLVLSPDPAYNTSVKLGIVQPLLKNFGSEVNRAQIAINHNARRRDVLALEGETLKLVRDVEEAYWNLVLARATLAIQQELLKKAIATRDLIAEREKFDASPVQRAQAESSVHERFSDLIRARTLVRQTSDNLKKLLNDPKLPLADEAVIAPVDQPLEAAVNFNLLDLVVTAVRRRPEARQALLAIDDEAIRQKVAANNRLPELNLSAQVEYKGLNDNGGGLDNSYDRLTDADYIEYLLGVQFEVPIGNREPEALYRRITLQKQAGVLGYARVSREIVLSVKRELRDQRAAYYVIFSARENRRAAAEYLRALESRELIEGMTPEFLDRKLRAQESQAQAEIEESRALAAYNVALMRVRLSEGTLLEHNQIEMSWPEGMFDDK